MNEHTTGQLAELSPETKLMCERPGTFSGGHRMCAGCPTGIFTKMLTRISDEYEIVAGNATGCLEVASSIFPYSAWQIPWIHTAFENASATMSGVEACYRSLVRQGKLKKKLKFVVMGGDGGTYDIGLQSLSGAMERGHDLTYICYDNGAYMNTGVQRSSATPLGAATTTTPVGSQSYGRKGNRKDLTKIMLAHNLGYVAQASIHDIGDLFRKMKKAIDHDGPSFINLLSPCIPGWKIDADRAVEIARLGVDCNFWPLFEVEQGKFTINYRPAQVKPVSEWVFSQGRFKHLKKHPAVVSAFQAEVDKQWAWLEMEEARTNPTRKS